ncbi:MAG: nitroreductase family protein [Anaerolineae bacterium]|nr:nitroreductase family protein [Anaerolineae bacterium]
MTAIAARRSIRHFAERPLPDDVLDQILHAATLAPSGKNRQPWRFCVVRGEQRAEMVRVMREGIARLEREYGVEPGSAYWSAGVMAQAPVTVFVFNPYAGTWDAPQFPESLQIVVDVQSAGAAIQNMLLAAQALGVGSLWICDVFMAIEELCGWLGETHQLVAAVSLGYADEAPGPRPRKSVDEVTRWIE